MGALDPKPGWKTTEFWISVAAQILAVVVLLGLMSQSDSETVGQAISQSIEAVGVIVANAAIILGYIKSRTTAKNGGNQP